MAVCEGGKLMRSSVNSAVSYIINKWSDLQRSYTNKSVPRLASLTPSPITFRTAESARRWC